jgi:alpha-L-fucosidase
VNPITINGINKAGNINMLGVEGNVKAKKSGNKLTISIPVVTPANNPSQFAWVFKIENAF